MKRQALLLLICACYLQTGRAQEITGSVGVSVQSMRHLRDFQDKFINDAVVGLESTQSFPPFLQYGTTISFKLGSKFKIGPSVYFTSTAARSSYADYSGEVRVDQSLQCVGTAAYINYQLSASEKHTVALYVLSGLEFSTLKMDVFVNVNQNIDQSDDTFHASSPMGELGIQYRWMLTHRLAVHLSPGVHLSKATMLTNDNDEEYEKVNWSGVKILTGLVYRF